MMDNTKIVICNGINRSGSTWSYLITREILKGVEFTDLGYLEGQEYSKINKSIDNNWVLLKSHYYSDYLDSFNQDEVYFIYTHRDMRGIYTSLMNKNDVSFDKVNNYDFLKIAATDYFKWKQYPNFMDVSYEDILENKCQLILSIADFLDVNISDERAKAINDEFSINNNRKRIASSKKGIFSKFKIFLSYLGILKNVKDEDSLLHYDHINDARKDNWKGKIDFEQQNIIREKYSNWLKEFGYLDEVK